jgi:hypothetical protein
MGGSGAEPTLTASASCGPAAGGVPGGRSTAGSAMCSFVVAAVGSEAEADPRGFKRAVAAAEARIEEVED